MRRIAALVLVLAGAFLLAVSLAGDRTGAGRYVNLQPRSWERFDLALASRTPDLGSLYRAAQGRARRNLREMPPQETMDLLYGVVSDRRHAYDPDFEVLVRDEDGKILSVEEAAARPDLLQRAYLGHGPSTQTASVLAIYKNTGDDLYVSYPPKGFFSPIGHWPGRVEQTAGLARYPLPAALIAAGALLTRPGRNRKMRPTR